MNAVLSRFAEVRFPKLWMPVALYVPLGVVLTVLSLASHPRSGIGIFLLVGSGLLAWTLIEYFLHRFVFHWTEVKEPWKSLASDFHMSHHEAVATQDVDYLLTRPAGSLPFAVIFYLLFALITWSLSAAALVMTGVFAGYLFYECFHYSAHRFHPKNRIGKFLRNYHLQHHFRFPNRRFGVTSPFWDFVFRSY